MKKHFLIGLILFFVNITSSQTSINLNDYNTGHYIITLVCDGKIVDSKNLIKN